MRVRMATFVVATALGIAALPGRPARGADPHPSADGAAGANPIKERKAIERALTFLEKDAVKWRTDRGCATCHHGVMTVWALSEAKSQGYTVSAEALADMVQWTREQFIPRLSEPKGTGVGANLLSVPALYLGVMSYHLPILSRAEVNAIALHLVRRQEQDGAWLLPPPANGAPPTWESRETIALWASLAWEPSLPTDQQDAAAARAGRAKAADFLRTTKPSDTTQAAGLRLLLDIRSGKDAHHLQAGVDQILKRQNPDGGWSQLSDTPSDAYATGQLLYFLSFAGVKHDRREIQRAVAFLVSTQRDDGSWPMTSRNHAGVQSTRNPLRNPIPITYFGSAWATLGLVRSVPAALDTVAKQQQALDHIRRFQGKHETNDQVATRPVVRVDLRYYELNDEEVGQFTNILQAFPALEALQFKSTKITDADWST